MVLQVELDYNLLIRDRMVSDIGHSGNQFLGDSIPDSVLFGTSAVMQELRGRLMRVCRTAVPVLLQGEVGVGKGALSRFIHTHSTGTPGPYVRIMCAALGESSPMTEPFLHLPGPEGSVQVHSDDAPQLVGFGTLFLEQVSELAPWLQRDLARSLAESEENTARDRHGVYEKVRIVCSSVRDLRHEVKLCHFRRDLFHRLAVVIIDVPPLRHHLEDLPGIAEYLRLRHSSQLAGINLPFPGDLLARMASYPWPGNIRELENFVCRYVVLGGEECSLCESATEIHPKSYLDVVDRGRESRQQKWRS